MSDHPIVSRGPGHVQVILAPFGDDVSRRRAKFVLDFDMFHDVVGIEVLGLKRRAGHACLQDMVSKIDFLGRGIEYCYDAEADALYLRLAAGRSLDQEAVDGVLLLNEDGTIVGFESQFRSCA